MEAGELAVTFFIFLLLIAAVIIAIFFLVGLFPKPLNINTSNSSNSSNSSVVAQNPPEVDNLAKTKPVEVKRQAPVEVKIDNGVKKEVGRKPPPKSFDSPSYRILGLPVIDACSYSSQIVLLCSNLEIILEGAGKNTRRVTPNIQMWKIDSFAGQIFGIKEGKVYQLDLSTYEEEQWNWKIASWAPESVVHISATLDTEYLWLQNNSEGFLYDSNFTLIERTTVSSLIRNYGLTSDRYVVIYPEQQTAVISFNNKAVYNVGYATLNSSDQLVVLQPQQLSRIPRVKIVNWIPYYFSK